MFQRVDGRAAAAGLPGIARPARGLARSLPALVLGFVLLVTTLVTVEIALGLVFDPRSRDFPFAGLTMAAVPVWTVALLYRRKSDIGVNAEAVFAGLLGAAALFLVLNEGVHNWQSLWTAAAFVLFGAALWSPRSVAVWRIDASRTRRQPIAVASAAAAAAGGFVVATSQVECDK